MYTVFYDDFNGNAINRNFWNVNSHYKRSLGFLVDNPLNINVANSKLELKMRYVPNYLDSIWKTTGWQHVYSDYTGAEISTKQSFRYGSFECSAKFAHEKSSWPAFWIIGGDGTPCPPGGYGNEIDIAEFKCDDSDNTLDHVIHRYYPPANCDNSNHQEKDFYAYRGMSFDDNDHIFKCVWSPENIKHYIDNVFTHQVTNTGQEWYPSLYLSVILSQQVIDPLGAPIAPQTSYFDFVRVKQFFLSPEITVPTYVCSTGTATLDVDPLASNITWQLTPSSLFTTSSGTGKTANIVRAAGAVGTGNIQYTFQMPSGETFTANKDILIGAPPTPVITGSWAPRCGYTYPYFVSNILATDNATYYWESDILEISNPTSKVCTAWPTFDGEGTITCTVTACGVSRTESRTVLAKLCYEYEVELFPNPSSDIMEVSLTKKTLENGTEIQEDDGAIGYVDPVFNVRVASQMGTVVYTAKTTKKKFSIPVSNFQIGNYYLEINDHKNSFRKQFIVKH